MNNERYENLNSVTLYKTPMFNKVDTLLFSSISERENYFNNISNSDKLVMEEFTDLYEGRNLVLPYNYKDLKRYNTMRLYYNDGLGHEAVYYCNVDNYNYLSTNACVPIYRIDYFLTFGYLLYNKDLDVITQRRSVKNELVSLFMKSDETGVPRVKYQRKDICKTSKSYYLIFLNNTSYAGFKDKGVKLTINHLLGLDSNHQSVYEFIADYTIGTYLCVCDEDGLKDRLQNETSDYFEQIIECKYDVTGILDPASKQAFTENHYAYLFTDFSLINPDYHIYINGKIDFGNDYDGVVSVDVNDLNVNYTKKLFNPAYRHKILNRSPYSGFVINGTEFDANDFREEYINLSDDITKSDVTMQPGMYFYLVGDKIFCVPVGYRGETINKEFIQVIDGGKNIPYTSDYTKTLAYKRETELNNRAIINAQNIASIEQYYQKILNNNANVQLQIQKQQSALSYQMQINNVNTELKNITSWQSILGDTLGNGLISTLTNAIKGVINSTEGGKTANNVALLTINKVNYESQRKNSNDLYDLQIEAQNSNYAFQCDLIEANKNNTIANLNIANKYNSLNPNIYKQADYSEYMNYYYIYSIDNLNETDFSAYNNLLSYYSSSGVYLGYKEKVKLNDDNGAYFNYIQCNIIDTSNILADELTYSTFIELASRLETGVRIWKMSEIEHFGDTSLDNFELYSEPYNTFTDDEKSDLNNYISSKIYTNSKLQIDGLIESSGYNLTEKSYLKYLNNSYYWGNDLVIGIELYLSNIAYQNKTDGMSKDDNKEYFKNLYGYKYSIKEIVYALNYIDDIYS